MKRKFKSYESQAQLSVILGVIGGACTLVAAGAVFQRFDLQSFWVRYSKESILLPAVIGTLLFALAASTIGFFVGLHSAGQRRNKRSRLSWTGFFLNAGVITLALSTGVFFWIAKYAAVAMAARPASP